MDSNSQEYIKRCAESDRLWAEIRDNEDRLYRLVNLNKPEKEDLMWAMVCVNLVYADLCLYDEEYQKSSIHFLDKERPVNPVDFIKDVAMVATLMDAKIPMDKKQDIIESLRTKVWGLIYTEKERIRKLVMETPDYLDDSNALLIYRCIFLVAFELKIKEIEIKILGGDYFS